jgi:nifR3 family TIM-barrel protein
MSAEPQTDFAYLLRSPRDSDRDVLVDPAAVLAPMEGITDRSFRCLIRGLGGVGLTVTEFVNCDGLTRRVARQWRYAELDPDEHPVAIQIYGRDPAKMADAARICVDLGADVVDLNLGCPSKAVTSGCAGSALMREPVVAEAIFNAVGAATEVPWTVKMRLGWDRESLNAPLIARMAEDAGAAQVAVHGRTRMCGYKGHADWASIATVKDAVSVPVLVNGDILTIEDADEALRLSRADGVMVGRGVMRDPWLLRRISEHRQGRTPYTPTLAERRALLIRYFDIIREESPAPKIALGRLKKVTGYVTRGLPGGPALRMTVYHSGEVERAYEAVEAYFDKLRAEGITDGFDRVHLDPSDTYKTTDSRRLDPDGRRETAA